MCSSILKIGTKGQLQFPNWHKVSLILFIYDCFRKKYIEKIAIFRKCNMCKYLIISWCKTVLSRLSHYFFLPHLFLFLHLYIILWPLIHSSEVYNFSTLSVSTLHFSFLLPPFLSSPSASNVLCSPPIPI